MVKATETWTLSVPAEKAWALMGDFGALHKVSPAVVASDLEEDGMIRRLTFADGSQFIERLVARDEAARLFGYEITGAVGVDLPFSRYVGTYRVIDDVPGESCIFELVCEYEAEGFTEADALDDMHGFYDACMEAVQKA